MSNAHERYLALEERIRKIAQPVTNDPDQGWDAYENLEEIEKALRVWQPIETAPRDGSRVLGASRLDGRPWFVEIVKWNAREGVWASWQGTRVVQPAQWMPLPEVPQ